MDLAIHRERFNMYLTTTYFSVITGLDCIFAVKLQVMPQNNENKLSSKSAEVIYGFQEVRNFFIDSWYIGFLIWWFSVDFKPTEGI